MQAKSKLMSRAGLILAFVFLYSVGAMAQEVRSQISVQGTGFLTKDNNGQGISQKSTEIGGVLAGYRYRLNHWLSADAVYGWNRYSQSFVTPAGTARVKADTHQVTGGLVFNLPAPAKFHCSPYVLTEGGALVFNPTNSGYNLPGADSQAVGTFVYGGGADFAVPTIRHLAVRVEYRGFVYNSPDFGLKVLNTNTITHSAQPSAGLVYSF
jgi:opacity protein-like surface antigen